MVVDLMTSDPSWGNGLARLLSSHGMTVRVIDPSGTGRSDEIEPEVLLLDLDDDLRPMELVLAELEDQYPLIEVIALYSEDRVQSSIRAVRSGVYDVLPKTVGPKILVEKVQAAHQRQTRSKQRMEALRAQPWESELERKR